MAIRTQIRLEQLTGSLNDGVAAVTVIDADSLQGVQDALASAIKRITGAASYSAAAAGVFSQTIVPAASGVQALGSATAEWGDLFIADDKKIQLGSDQDWSIEYDEDGTDLALIAGANMRITGNSGAQELQFRASTEGIKSTAASTMNVFAAADVHLDAPGFVKVSNDMKLQSDSAVLAFGAGDDVTLTHENDVGLLLNSDNQLQFGDSATHIAQSADGNLKLTSDESIEMAVGAQGVKITGTTPKLTIGDAGAEDSSLVFDGNAQDFYMGLDDGTDKLMIGLGSAVGTTPNMTLESATRNVQFHGDIQVDGKDIRNSTGAVAITLNTGGEVVIPGDLTVKGTTTTVDTTNLLVEDKLVGLNYTSGSISGGAGDVGFVMGQTGGNSPAAIAFYYDSGDTRFKIVQTATAASGTNITDGAWQDLQLGDLYLEGLDVYGDGTGKAISLSTGDSPDVGVQNNLTMLDDKSIIFGDGSDAQIKYDEAASDKLQILAGGAGALMSVSAGDIVLGHSGLGAASLGDVLKIQKIGTDGVVQVSGSIHSFGNDLILSASGGKELKHQSGASMMFLDVFKPASWSDADGIKLAANAASWTGFEAAYGEVSLLDAIVSAGGGAGTIQKRTVEVTGSAGFPQGYSVPLNMDLDALSTADCDERVDIYVNGQLMVSSSEVTGNGDYALIGPIDASVPAVFQFALAEDDVIQAVVR